MKPIVFSLFKLVIAAAIILFFVEADFTVQVALIYLIYIMLERTNEITALSEKVDIQKERIDELESMIESNKK
jgi:cell division protein FtsL